MKLKKGSSWVKIEEKKPRVLVTFVRQSGKVYWNKSGSNRFQQIEKFKLIKPRKKHAGSRRSDDPGGVSGPFQLGGSSNSCFPVSARR